MLNIENYKAPTVGLIQVQLESIIAESTCPRIKDNDVWYEDYETKNLSTPVGEDVLVF
jgi:hypothetical protein